MKNEVKLNIHMFYPEQLDKEISNNEHQALSKLLSLEYESLYSIEMFIAELKSRWTIIELIMKEQTASFLGYTLSDIAKVDNFFAKKFEKFGMEAVEVQKILRNIWMKTPCEDKRLDYELFVLVDNEFYEIVQERKKLISFEHISSPTGSSLEELKNNWEERRRHYAEQLQVDIDYLDNEAVDGNMFPSASGLFANPSPPDEHSDCSVLEFLNFWMPHLYPSPFNPVFVMPSESIMPNLGKGNLYIEFIQDENLQSDDELSIDIVKKMSFIKHCEYVNSIFEKFPCSSQWLNAYKMYFKNITERFGNWEKSNEKRFYAETNNVLKNALPELDKLVGIDELQKAYYISPLQRLKRANPDEQPQKSYLTRLVEMAKQINCEFVSQVNNEEHQNSYKIWYKSKDIILKYLKEYYRYFQPRYFYLLSPWKKTKHLEKQYFVQSFCSSTVHRKDFWDEQQLPIFFNSCKEYVLDKKCLVKRNLAFFSEGKVYFPNESILDDISDYDKLFEATGQLLPQYPTKPDWATVKQSLIHFEQYTEECYKNLFIRKEKSSPVFVGGNLGAFISKTVCLHQVRFYKLLGRYFEFFNNEKLLKSNKIGILIYLKRHFQEALSWSYGGGLYGKLANEELIQLENLIEKMIGPNSEKDIVSTAYTTIENEIEYFYALDENEKLNLQNREQAARIYERDSIITTICHNINGSIGSIKTNLDANVKNAPENIRFALKRALDGATMIGNMVATILKSYKYNKEKFLYDIENADTNDYSLEDIIYENLYIAIENIFSDDFRDEQKCFFSNETDKQNLQDIFYRLSTNEDIEAFINKNFMNMEIRIPQNFLNMKIGDKNGTATNTYVIVNEFMKNAFRALAYVQSAQRRFSLKASESDNQIIFEMKNTCTVTSNRYLQTKGYGGLITENIIKAFGELSKSYSEDGQLFSLKVIIHK